MGCSLVTGVQTCALPIFGEVKGSIADFRADRKWEGYGDFCDRFYFAVAYDFPQELIPDHCGLMIADGYDASILREGPATPLAPARRKTLLLRFGRLAAERLHRLEIGRASCRERVGQYV